MPVGGESTSLGPPSSCAPNHEVGSFFVLWLWLLQETPTQGSQGLGLEISGACMTLDDNFKFFSMQNRQSQIPGLKEITPKSE